MKKKKEWKYQIIRGEDKVEKIADDVFYTSDTEAFLVFKLEDPRLAPRQALLNLHNRNDGSVVSETVLVEDGVIEWEMREEVIEHAGNWQVQVIYEQLKDGEPEKYTAPIINFPVKNDLLNQKTTRLIAVENWHRLITNAGDLVENLEELETTYQELLDTGVLQTNINNKLEDLETEYAPRLTNLEQNDVNLNTKIEQTKTEVTTQLAQTMTQVEFDSWVATLLDGGPSIFMDSLAVLQSTYPDGAAGVALVRETDPAKIYVWNGSAWEDFGDYQGLEIKQGSVEYRSTDFLKLDTSKNLFDGNWMTAYLAGYGGNYHFRTDRNGNVFILEVSPSTTYSIALSNDVETYLKLAESTNLVADGTQPDGVGKELGLVKNILHTTSPEANYLYISTTNLDLPAPFMKIVKSDVIVPIAEGEVYPINPVGINVYSKDEVNDLFGEFLTEENEEWVI